MNVRNAFSRFLLISAVLLTPLAAMAQALPARSPMIAVRDGGSAYVVTDVAGEASCRDATPEEAKIVNARSTVPMKIFGEDKGPIRTNATAGLNIVLRGTAQLDANPQAKAAFERAAEIWESQIANPVTVIVDVDFGPTRFGVAFPENVIASASSDSYRFSNGDYAEVRLLLIDRADNGNELSLYTALPATAIPADVNAGSVNNFVGPSILLRTLGVLPQFPPVATPADDSFPNIGFNSAFQYDFDPTDGISAQRKDFEGVVVHELGHMLGFTSGVGRGEILDQNGNPLVAAPTVLDFFRFRPGVTLTSFTLAQRILTTGGDQILFIGGPDLGLSTGNPNGENGDLQQASHWKDDALTGVRVGIMDPTLASARRSELTQNDLNAFAFFGYTLSTDVVVPQPTVPAAPTGLNATTLSTSSIRLNWTDNASDETEVRIERKSGNGAFADIGPAAANATTLDVTGLSAGTQHTFRVRARNAVGDSAYSNEASATTNITPGPCVANGTTVCLLSNRFKVVIDYVNPFSNPPNQPGTFLAARLLSGVQNPDTALFGFNSAQAVEVVVRIQDTRPFAPRFDVYYGGMTDVGYVVTVSDTQTGVTRQYRNNAGNVGGGVDRASFPAN
jgi:hypothetical protein